MYVRVSCYMTFIALPSLHSLHCHHLCLIKIKLSFISRSCVITLQVMLCMCMCIFVCMCVCVMCVCVCVCVCMCMCVLSCMPVRLCLSRSTLDPVKEERCRGGVRLCVCMCVCV